MTPALPFPAAGSLTAFLTLAWLAGTVLAGGSATTAAATTGVVLALVGAVATAGHGLDSAPSIASAIRRSDAVPLAHVALTLAAGAATAVAWWAVEGTVAPGIAVLIAAAPIAYSLAGSLPLRMARLRGRAVGVQLVRLDRLHVASRLDIAVLDRWGTVTTGDLTVTSVDPVEPDHDRNLRWFAGALEHAADDPVGRAISRLSARGRLSNVVQHPGRGISGTVDRHPVRVGRPQWIGIEDRNCLGTTVGVEVDSRVLGHITVADDIRTDARAGVERLRRDGIDPVLVSDDTSLNTEHLAEACGIEHWIPESAPEKRGRLVIEHQERGRVVAVASGGGPHDEALAAADLALSDRADPPVDIQLVDLSVARVGAALALARSARHSTRRGRRLALGLAALGLGLAAAGLLTPLLAAGYAAASCVAGAAVSLRVRA